MQQTRNFFMLLHKSNMYFITTNLLITVPINISFRVFIILYSILIVRLGDAIIALTKCMLATPINDRAVAGI